jgi:hypothetical protein
VGWVASSGWRSSGKVGAGAGRGGELGRRRCYPASSVRARGGELGIGTGRGAASTSPASHMPLAGARRARLWPEHAADARSRRGAWRSDGEACGRGEGGEQEAVVGEAAEELGGKVRPARGRERHAS